MTVASSGGRLLPRRPPLEPGRVETELFGSARKGLVVRKSLTHRLPEPYGSLVAHMDRLACVPAARRDLLLETLPLGSVDAA